MAETTTKINARKQESVLQVKSLIGDTTDILFTDFRGLNVGQISDLRQTLKENHSDYKVIKNNYTKIAIEELGLPDVSDFLVGPTAIAVIRKDAGPVAKVLIDFSKETSVQVKGGIIRGKLFQQEQIQELSKLPSKDQLLAMLMSTIKAPLQNFVYVLNGVTEKLALTLKAVADKKAQDQH